MVVLYFLRDTRVGCTASLAPLAVAEEEEEGRSVRERWGGSRPTLECFLLSLSSLRVFLGVFPSFGGLGMKEIRTPYYMTAIPVWDRVWIFCKSNTGVTSTAELLLWPFGPYVAG